MLKHPQPLTSLVIPAQPFFENAVRVLAEAGTRPAAAMSSKRRAAAATLLVEAISSVEGEGLEYCFSGLHGGYLASSFLPYL